jgi:hypothetical protein
MILPICTEAVASCWSEGAILNAIGTTFPVALSFLLLHEVSSVSQSECLSPCPGFASV